MEKKEIMLKPKSLFYGNKISPLASRSLELCSQFVENYSTVENKQPFFMIYPNKHNTALICALGLLMNFYKEDFERGREFGLDKSLLEKGQRLNFFGGICEVVREVDKEIVVKFSNGEMYACAECLRFAKPVNGKRLSKIERYFEGKKSTRKQQTFSFLSADGALVNSAWLNSEILFVAGRGNVMDTRRFLEKRTINDGEKLKEILPNNNLIIKEDLEEFKVFLSKNDEDKETYFKLRLQQILKQIPDDEALSETKNTINALLEYNDFRTTEFVDLYEDLCENIGEDEIAEQLVELKDREFPGIKTDFPKQLKAVFINDIHQFEAYPNVVELFQERGIPVIAVDDWVSPGYEFNYDRFFKERESAFALQWNREKIKELETNKEDEPFLDQVFWESSLRHSRQKIRFLKVEDERFDKAFGVFERSKVLMKYDGFELLKKSYYQTLRPAIYALKNAPAKSIKKGVNQRIKTFRSNLNHVAAALAQDDFETMSDALTILENGNFKEKPLPQNGEILFLQAMADKELIDFAQLQGILTTKHISREHHNIMFSGFPLGEFSNKLLLETIMQNQALSVTLTCYPKELSLTKTYLDTRYRIKQFKDQLPAIMVDLVHRSRQQETPFIMEADKDIFIEKTEEILSIQEAIKNFRYGEYLPGNASQDAEEQLGKVSCDILLFQSGGFLFLPKSSKIKRLSFEENKWKLRSKKFKEITRGDYVVGFSLDRDKIVRLAKNAEQTDKYFDVLEGWRNTLKEVFKRQGNNLRSVAQFMCQKAPDTGSPTPGNISRWINDQTLISPERENLTLIFKAYGIMDEERLEQEIEQVFSAKKVILQLHQAIRNALKSKLFAYLEKQGKPQNSFHLKIEEVPVHVQMEKVTGKEQSKNYLIKYSNTRKIITEPC